MGQAAIKKSEVQIQKNIFESFLKAIPFIDLNSYLIWDGDEASYKNDEHDIEFDNWQITCKLEIYKTISTRRASYDQPPEYHTLSQDIKVTLIDIWDKKKEEYVTLTPEQVTELENQ